MRPIILSGLALLIVSAPTWPQCGTQVLSGYTTPSSMGWDSVNVVGYNFPPALAGAVAAAREIWNDSSCNTSSGNAFPYFGAVNGSFTVTVSWDPGSRADGACATFNPTTRQITVYGQSTENGNPVNCLGHNPDAIAIAIAHELGHFLGLDNTPSFCSREMMMSPFAYDYSTGQFVPKEPAPTECETANSINVTNEEKSPPPPDPLCDAYCWTTCVNNQCPSGNPWCPILMDTENDGIRLTGLEDPVWFDIDANGTPNLMAWTDRGDGLLALDRNGNGSIDDGQELFGNATPLINGSRASNGYVALAELDSWILGGNEDGMVSATDSVYESLLLWTDANHDGRSQPDELRPLSAAGIRQIGLDYRRSSRADRHGNEFRFRGLAWKATPYGILRPILTWDVFFVVAH